MTRIILYFLCFILCGCGGTNVPATGGKTNVPADYMEYAQKGRQEMKAPADYQKAMKQMPPGYPMPQR